MLVISVVEVIAGIVLVVVANWGRQGRLTADSGAGVRLPSTTRSPAAFNVANKAAAPWTGTGGILLAIGGILSAVFPRHDAGIFVFGGIGVCMICCLIGTAAGTRAARSAP